jgi:hypothetical protein
VGEAVAVAPAATAMSAPAGSYVEDVAIQAKPLRLWGKCPAEVELVGTGASPMATTVFIGVGASGSEVAGLAVRGPAMGVGATGAEWLELHGLWIHDTTDRGINIEDALGPTSVRIASSLIEQGQEMGVFVSGADVELESTVVRGTLPMASTQDFGRGIDIQDSPDPDSRARLSVHGSLVEHNRDAGLVVTGADAEIEAVVVRDTLPRALDQTGGRGINIQSHPTTDARSNVVLRASLVEHNHEVGVFVANSDVKLAATVVRGTFPQPSDQTGGRGISMQDDSLRSVRASASLRAVLVEHNQEIGVHVSAMDAEIEAVVVRGTLPQASNQLFGRGMNVQDDPAIGVPSNVAIRASLVEQNHEIGVIVLDSTAQLRGVRIVDSFARPHDGLVGDGLLVWSMAANAAAELSSCHIGQNARAGISSFGGAVSLHAASLSCNTIHLASETHEGRSPVLTDAGDNRCACGQQQQTCTALSVGLEPPERVDAVE